MASIIRALMSTASVVSDALFASPHTLATWLQRSNSQLKEHAGVYDAPVVRAPVHVPECSLCFEPGVELVCVGMHSEYESYSKERVLCDHKVRGGVVFKATHYI